MQASLPYHLTTKHISDWNRITFPFLALVTNYKQQPVEKIQKIK
jgi:hypothetical protein